MNIDPMLIRNLKKQSRIVVLTGAGVSAESGIPTFRDAQSGLWANCNPEELASIKGFERSPQLVLDWYKWRRDIVLKAEPNSAHLLLGEWERHFPNFLLVTQNVDGLHQKAGSEKVIELHGSIHRMRCMDQGHVSIWSEGREARCRKCLSLLRPDIVWFGEELSGSYLQEIDRALWDADIFIAIGTSGTVTPASTFLSEAKRRGAVTVVINTDESAQGYAEFFLKGKATEVIAELTRLLKAK